MMKKILFAVVALGMLIGLRPAAAQMAKVYRIGYLQTAPRSAQLHLIDAFERGIKERGYSLGQNVHIEYRFADGNIERLPQLAAELVRLNVDVILTGVNVNTRAARQATSTIPIVMATSHYPVEDGLVASLAHPGGNITGLSQDTGEEVGKRLQILREVAPRLKRVAALSGAGMSYNAMYVKALEQAASAAGISVLALEIQGARDVEQVFSKIERARVEGLIVFPGPITLAEQGEITRLTARKRLPAIWGANQPVVEGAWMSYGPDVPDRFWRAAGYVDRIFK